MSSRWQPSGYAAQGIFAGVHACRYRIAHCRDGGVCITTLGHYIERGGRLMPISPGYNFCTWVTREDPETGEVEELERAACNDHRTALAQHMALLDAWEHREPQEA